MKKKQAPDAIDLLDADHLEVHGLFQAYRELVRGDAEALQRHDLAEEICMALTIHARLEDELFYPALRTALGDDELLDEVQEPGGGQRELVAQILSTSAGDELLDARVAALARHVERHVQQEREQVFNRALASRLDLHSLGRAISLRRAELRAVQEALREEALAAALA